MSELFPAPSAHLFDVPEVGSVDLAAPCGAHDLDESSSLFKFLGGDATLPSIFDLDEELRSDLALYRLKVAANLDHGEPCLPSLKLYFALLEHLNPRLRGAFLGRHRYISAGGKA